MAKSFKGYKRYTLEQAMNIIREKGGIRGLTIDELRSVGRPMMPEVRRRLTALRKAGYIKAPAPRAYLEMGLKTTTNIEERFKLLHEVYEAYLFLEAKTSTVEGTERYLKNIEPLFNKTMGPTEANKLWAALDILRKEQPELFEKFSYNVVMEELAVQSGDFKKSRPLANRVEEILKDFANKVESEIDESEDIIYGDIDDLPEIWLPKVTL